MTIKITETPSEKDLFLRIFQTRNSQYLETFAYDVETVAGLLKFLVGAKETPIIRAENISHIVGREVNLKLENTLLPGASAKGRAVYGIIFQYLREHLAAASPAEIEALANDLHPLRALLKATFDNSIVVANSAGNHAVSVAAVLGRLASDEVGEQYRIKTLFTAFVPENAPPLKQNLIITGSPNVEEDGLRSVQFYGTKEDRNEVLARAERQFTEGGQKAFSFPTEPNERVYGGFIGLATQGAEVTDWARRSGRVATQTLVPSSSSPTAGSAIRLSGNPKSVIFVQDIRNGGFVLQLLRLAEEGKITLTPEQAQELGAKKLQIQQAKDERRLRKDTSGAANGASTPHVNEQVIREITGPNGELLIDANQVKIVKESALKLAAGLVYLETIKLQEVGATLPEPAGSLAVGAILEEAALQRNSEFSTKIASFIADYGYDNFIKLTGLKDFELEYLGLENLQTQVAEAQTQTGWSSSAPRKNLPYERSEVATIAVISGANTDQPLELELRNYIKQPNLENAKRLVEAFAVASPTTIYQIAIRDRERTITANTGNEFVYHSGEQLSEAIKSALDLQQADEISRSAEGGFRFVDLVERGSRIAKGSYGLDFERLVASSERGDINAIIEEISSLQSEAREFLGATNLVVAEI